MKILGFYHILMKNHFLEIVSEQMNCIIESGLYDRVEEIQVGAVGDQKELQELHNLLGAYPKFIINYFGYDILQYEFPTLDLLKKRAEKEDFYTFYIHTKGASFDKSHERGYCGGNYWRGYMNFYTILNWRNALAEIEKGTDVCGVKLRGTADLPSKRLHFSGNFFWTHSAYVQKLPAIEKLNRTNRFEAEFWHGSASPKTHSMCQDFIDYNSKGVWKNPVITEKRNIVHTLCWNTYDQVQTAVSDLYARNERKDFIHVLVDLGFPIETGDVIPEDIEIAKASNTNKLKFLAEKYGSIYFKAENIGVSQNWTQVAQFMKVTDHDVLICADPDERVQTDGWVKALCDVMRANPKYGWISLMMPEQLEILNKKNTVEFTYLAIKTWEIIGNMNWAQGAMSGKLIKQMGGKIPHPDHYGIYGGLESATQMQMKRHGYKWAMLPDYLVVHTNEVPLLRSWKDLIIHEIKRFGQVSFDEFLVMKKRGLV